MFKVGDTVVVYGAGPYPERASIVHIARNGIIILDNGYLFTQEGYRVEGRKHLLDQFIRKLPVDKDDSE